MDLLNSLDARFLRHDFKILLFSILLEVLLTVGGRHE